MYQSLQQGQNYGGIDGSIGSGQGQQLQLLQQQSSYHHQQHQPMQQYSSRTTVHPGYGYWAGPGTSSQSVATQPAGYGIEQSAMQQQQQQQEMLRQQQFQQDPQRYYQQEHQSALRQDLQSPLHQQQWQNPPCDTAREDQRVHGQEYLLHRQSDDALSSSPLITRAVATGDL